MLFSPVTVLRTDQTDVISVGWKSKSK